MRLPKFVELTKVSGKRLMVQLTSIEAVEISSMDKNRCVVLIAGKRFDLLESYTDVFNKIKKYIILC